MWIKSLTGFTLGFVLIFATYNSVAAVVQSSETLLSEDVKHAINAYSNKEYSRAIQLFTPLAEQNNVFAQFGLAQMHRLGQGGAVDYALALKWYLKASQSSYGVAQSQLGEMYEQGLGVPVDLAMAKNWYQVSCSNQCSQGCLNFSRLEQTVQ
jgi:TPR repeat protein